MFKSTQGSYNRSFLGSYIFKQLVPKDHPMRTLSEIANFSHLDEDLSHLYSKKGQKAYQPSLMTRILIIKDLYNVSDERVIQMVNENIPVRMYIGISLEEKVPESSDLTYFRKRLGPDNFNKIFQKTIDIAKENGLQLGDILLLDSTHSEAKINQKTQKKADNNHNDKDAVFARKNKKKTFFGYKHHSANENNHNLIMAIQTTKGNVYDGSKLEDIVEEARENINPSIVSADKGYDKKENYNYLIQNSIFPSICLKNTRLQTKNKEFKYYDKNGNDNRYFQIYIDQRYEKGQKQRYKVEQSYGEMKNYHGLRRCKYLGLEKTKIQAYTTATVYNLKHILTFISQTITHKKFNNLCKT